MGGFDAVSSYLLVVAIAALLVAVLVWQPLRDKRTVNVWLASGVVGILLGSVLTYALMRLEGYTQTQGVALSEPMAQAAASESSCSMSPQPDCPMRAKMMAMAASQGAAGMAGPQPKRDLATLVQKLDLLTGDIAITLTAEQATAVSDCLRDIEKPEKMSDDEAKAKRSKLIAVLTESQLDRLEAIAIPQPAAGSGPGTASCPMMGGGMPGSTSTAEASKPDPNQNPFQKDEEGEALLSLRERLAAAKAETKDMAKLPKGPPAGASAGPTKQ